MLEAAKIRVCPVVYIETADSSARRDTVLPPRLAPKEKLLACKNKACLRRPK